MIDCIKTDLNLEINIIEDKKIKIVRANDVLSPDI